MQQQPRLFLMRTSVSPYFMPHVLYYRTNTHPPLNILIFMALLEQSFRFFRTPRDAFPPSENASSCENCIDRGRKIRKICSSQSFVSKRSTQWAEKYRVHIYRGVKRVSLQSCFKLSRSQKVKGVRKIYLIVFPSGILIRRRT